MFGDITINDYFYLYLKASSIHEVFICCCYCSKITNFRKRTSFNLFKRKELDIGVSEIVFSFQTEEDVTYDRFPYLKCKPSRPLSNLLKNKISLKKFLRIKSDDLFISRITNRLKPIIIRISYIAGAE